LSLKGFSKRHDKEIRQITITGNRKIKPAIIITKDTGLQPVPLVWPGAGQYKPYI